MTSGSLPREVFIGMVVDSTINKAVSNFPRSFRITAQSLVDNHTIDVVSFSQTPPKEGQIILVVVNHHEGSRVITVSDLGIRFSDEYDPSVLQIPMYLTQYENQEGQFLDPYGNLYEVLEVNGLVKLRSSQGGRESVKVLSEVIAAGRIYPASILSRGDWVVLVDELETAYQSKNQFITHPYTLLVRMRAPVSQLQYDPEKDLFTFVLSLSKNTDNKRLEVFKHLSLISSNGLIARYLPRHCFLPSNSRWGKSFCLLPVPLFGW